MNRDRIEGNWKQFVGGAMEWWGALTHDRLEVIAGRRVSVAGMVQETYGIARDSAFRQFGDWPARIDSTRRVG